MSLQPVEYYNKLPSTPNVDACIVLDPMVATGRSIVLQIKAIQHIFFKTTRNIGNTAIAAVHILKEWGIPGENIRFMGLLAVRHCQLSLPLLQWRIILTSGQSKEGVENLQEAHPDITIYLAAIDEVLDSHG
jgi:uracil phosphoribosyltransferase